MFKIEQLLNQVCSAYMWHNLSVYKLVAQRNETTTNPKMLKEYLDASSIHGLQYLGAHRGPVRILWSAFIAASFGLAAWIVFLK